jgi:hypothetical protein
VKPDRQRQALLRNATATRAFSNYERSRSERSHSADRADRRRAVSRGGGPRPALLGGDEDKKVVDQLNQIAILYEGLAAGQHPGPSDRD